MTFLSLTIVQAEIDMHSWRLSLLIGRFSFKKYQAHLLIEGEHDDLCVGSQLQMPTHKDLRHCIQCAGSCYPRAYWLESPPSPSLSPICGQYPPWFSFSPSPKGRPLHCKLSYLKGRLLYLGVLYHRVYLQTVPMWYNKASAELRNPVLLQLRGKKWPHWARRAHGGIIEMMLSLNLEV